MEPAEQEAFTLHAQRVPVETIVEKTLLSRPQIAAAGDLGRLHAQATLKATVPPAQATPKPRVRNAAVRQLPGATIAPAPTLAEPADLVPAAREPAAAAPPAVPATPARPAPKQHLRKPAKQPGKPFDRDEKIRVLKALIEGVRKHLTEWEAELAELLDTTPEPAPVPEPAPEPAPSAPPKACAPPDPATSPEARAWATAAGWAVPADGERLPGAIVLAYHRAHGGTQ